MPDPSPAVLVVDDQESPRRCLVRVLEHRGCRVLAAADGLRFADAEPALLCVFLDLSMPRMGGAEVLRRLRAAGRDTPVVLMSGFSEAEWWPRWRPSSASRHFRVRPWDGLSARSPRSARSCSTHSLTRAFVMYAIATSNTRSETSFSGPLHRADRIEVRWIARRAPSARRGRRGYRDPTPGRVRPP